MKYVLLAFESEADFADRNDPERSEGYWGAWMAYSAALSARRRSDLQGVG